MLESHCLRRALSPQTRADLHACVIQEREKTYPPLSQSTEVSILFQKAFKTVFNKAYLWHLV